MPQVSETNLYPFTNLYVCIYSQYFWCDLTLFPIAPWQSCDLSQSDDDQGNMTISGPASPLLVASCYKLGSRACKPVYDVAPEVDAHHPTLDSLSNAVNTLNHIFARTYVQAFQIKINNVKTYYLAFQTKLHDGDSVKVQQALTIGTPLPPIGVIHEFFETIVTGGKSWLKQHQGKMGWSITTAYYLIIWILTMVRLTHQYYFIFSLIMPKLVQAEWSWPAANSILSLPEKCKSISFFITEQLCLICYSLHKTFSKEVSSTLPQMKSITYALWISLNSTLASSRPIALSGTTLQYDSPPTALTFYHSLLSTHTHSLSSAWLFP